MKKRIVLSLLVGLFLLTTAAKSQADEYLGDFCWQVFNQDGQPYWFYNFGIYRKEGGHLVLFGSVDYGANGLSASHGNAIIVGENIKMTIVSSDYEDAEGEVWSETFSAVLRRSTLNGEWDALSIQKKDRSSVRPIFQSGTMSSVACQ